MPISGHHRPALAALLSLGALTAFGCSAEWEAGTDDAREEATLEASSALACKRHLGVHGEWSAAAPLPVARTRHSALLMPDGRVLVAGGFGAYPYPTSVLFYDPASDSWTNNGSLDMPPEVTPALLPDGRVLFSPGEQVYDPSTATSTAVPLTPAEQTRGWAFHYSTLTPLPSGLVLRTGGTDDDFDTKEAVLYDPATNTWSSAANMSVSRKLHTATLLKDGRVLVVGGYTLDSNERPKGRTSAEIYDPATGTWSAAASTHVPRMQHTATLLKSGRVLVVGGGGQIYSSEYEDAELLVEARNTAEIYDPATNTWTETAPPHLSHHWDSTSVAMSKGRRVMAIGSSGAEIYKEATDTWTVIDAPVPRGFHTATALEDGPILITGGSDGTAFSNPAPLTSVELYGNHCP